MPSKSCPKPIAEVLQDWEEDDTIYTKNPLFLSTYAEVIKSNLKKEEDVILVATESKIYFF